MARAPRKMEPNKLTPIAESRSAVGTKIDREAAFRMP